MTYRQIQSLEYVLRSVHLLYCTYIWMLKVAPVLMPPIKPDINCSTNLQQKDIQIYQSVKFFAQETKFQTTLAYKSGWSWK